MSNLWKNLSRAIAACILCVSVISGCGNSAEIGSDEFDGSQVVDLISASIYGNSQLFEETIANGVDVNSVGRNGFTPLYYLTRMNDVRSVWAIERLLYLGADPHFIPEGKKYSSFFWAAREADPLIFKAFLETGVDVNRRYESLQSEPTAIFQTIMGRISFNVELAVRHGADIEHLNSRQQTPLLFANTNNWEIVFFLLNAGANYDAKDFNGNSVVWALENNRYYIQPWQKDWREKVVDFLRERGVKLKPWMPPSEKD